MQQGVKTDATCNIQQCWELLAQGFTHCVKKQQTACSLPFFAQNRSSSYLSQRDCLSYCSSHA